MTAAFKTWTVLPHGQLTPLTDDILTVLGEIPMPVGDFPRRMTVVRLHDRRLVIFSAVALDEPQMQALEAFGTPTFLIVPNAIHRLDACTFKQRYPAIQVIAPRGALLKVEEVVPVDATEADFADPHVRLIEVGGTQSNEFAIEVTRPDGSTLILNDLVANIHGEHGFTGWLLRLMKFAGDEPHIPGPVQKKLVEDKAALVSQLMAWSHLPNLQRIVVSHGDVIEDDPPEALRRLAASLA
ncbi:MAG: hypothetical protein JWR84_4204 [Caulobacter sp.]|nr:hypothetical protein [Caulobacter sp.]